ncbi:hypothetical protein L596_005674 [Steinernema carpocapsae]|uniref:BEACH domain-containing protein n=1 Tax=Steinernema carpocapsae TaxID=34508 RepID=A0A4U8V412_STECR|nr:hypothetical protein L596_005674 [Steinernema carpocapsae]
MFRCARIQGLDTSEGLLLFGKEHYYVVDGFTLLKTREIRDLDFLPEELHDPIVPYLATGATGRPVRSTRLCSKFSYDDIREVHKRGTFCSQSPWKCSRPTGGTTCLPSLDDAQPRLPETRLHGEGADGRRKSVRERPESFNVHGALGSSDDPELLDRTIVRHPAMGPGRDHKLPVSDAPEHAGRVQRPVTFVLPWVLRDYDSEYLDLTIPSTFRDLSKPMGAQTPERLEQFLKRYREWDDPTGETPPYMYGTHYSTPRLSFPTSSDWSPLRSSS